MNRTSHFFLVGVALAAATAGAHNHITVDTVSGQPGDQILIRAGYLPSETAYTIVDGRLFHDGDIAVYEAPVTLVQEGPLNGWYIGDGLSLTSDFYFATGRLDGGDFQWEIVNVAAVRSGHAELAWGAFEGPAFTPLALSFGETRPERSFDADTGGHRHGQAFAFNEAGLFDITFVAWDSNGVYADSAPVTVRFQVGEPSCAADFNHDDAVNSQDFFDFLASFFAQAHEADFNRDEVVNSQDFFDFLTAFFTGC